MRSRKIVLTTLVLLALCHSANAAGPAGGQDKGGTPQDNKDKKAEDKVGGKPVVTVPKSTNPLQTPEMAADGFFPSDPSTWSADKKQRICDSIAKGWQKTYNSAVFTYQPAFDACMSGKYASGKLMPNQSVEMKMVCFTPTAFSTWPAAKKEAICDQYPLTITGLKPSYYSLWRNACYQNKDIVVEGWSPRADKVADYTAKAPSPKTYAYLEFKNWSKSPHGGMFTDSCGAGENVMNQGPGNNGRTSIPVAK